MQPRFNGICLISDDVTGLCAFYAELLQATVEGSDTFAFIRGPGAALSVFSRAGMEAMVPGSMDGAGNGSFTIEFEVDDVDARHEKLRGLGMRILKPPTTQPWGRRSLWLRDPDGNIVNLYQQAKSLSRTDHRLTRRVTPQSLQAPGAGPGGAGRSRAASPPLASSFIYRLLARHCPSRSQVSSLASPAGRGGQ